MVNEFGRSGSGSIKGKFSYFDYTTETQSVNFWKYCFFLHGPIVYCRVLVGIGYMTQKMCLVDRGYGTSPHDDNIEKCLTLSTIF